MSVRKSLLLILFFIIFSFAIIPVAKATKYDYEVPYISQLDYADDPHYIGHSACAPTSLTMLLQYYFPNSGIDVPEVYHSGIQGYRYHGPAKGYKNVSFKSPDPGLSIVDEEFREYYSGDDSGLRSPTAAAQYLNSVWGGESYGGNASFQSEVISEIKKGPLILNIYYNNDPTRPHYIVLRGYDGGTPNDYSDDKFYVNDPYPDWPNHPNGKNREFSYATLSSWYKGRIITFNPTLSEQHRQYTVVVDNGNVQLDDINNQIWWEYYGPWDNGGDWYYPTKAGHWAKWEPDLLVAGNYNIHVVFHGDKDQTNVTYKICTPGNELITTATVTVNQNVTGWRDVSLGTFYLEKGSFVRVDNVPAQCNVDAIRFEYVRPPDIGQGAPNPQLFVDCFNRVVSYEGKSGHDLFGNAVGAVRPWGNNGLIQHFKQDNHELAMVKRDGEDKVYAIYGAIWATYKYRLGGSDAPVSYLGYPTSDDYEASQSGAPGLNTQGRVQDFEFGHLYYHRTGEYANVTFETHGAIDKRYTQLGGIASSLGFPVTDEKEASQSPPPFNTTGRYSAFEGGVIHWLREEDQTWVIGINQPGAKAIADRYHAEGGSGSSLGFPINDDYSWPYFLHGTIRADFQRGYIKWHQSSGTKVRYYDISTGDDDTTPPLISLGLSLNEGTSVKAGDLFEIDWSLYDNVAGKVLLDLYYTLDDWLSAEKINPSPIENDVKSTITDSYAWTVPDTDTNEAAIRVVAYDEAANAGYDYSATLTITSDYPVPPAPTLYNPQISGNNYTISWSKVNEADSYILQEDTSSSFPTPTNHYLTQTSKYFSNKPYDTTYYYRVCAVNDYGSGPWSSIESVTTQDTPPGEITNMNPSDGATGQPLDLTLSWSCTHPAGENLKYNVYFVAAETDNFHTNNIVSFGQTQTNYTLHDLPYNTTCSWGIEAIDETGQTRFSLMYHFTTIADTTSPTGAILINDGAATTDSYSVILNLSASDAESGVRDMRFSNDGSSWSLWKYYSDTWSNWSLTDSRYGGKYGQTIYTVYAQLRDEEGNVSPTYSDTIEKVEGTPGDIILNGEYYENIRDAMDAATQGDTIYVTEGVYTIYGKVAPPRFPSHSVGIVMKPGVTLMGAGADKTKIELQGGLYTIVDADNALLQGLTLVNTSSGVKYGVYSESSSFQVKNCIFQNSYGAIVVNNASNTEIFNNLIKNNKEGIRFWGTNDSIKIYNNTICDNNLGGICADDSAIIKNNIVAYNGIGIATDGTMPTIECNDVYSNFQGQYEENYQNIDDQTGINGNISSDPLLTGDYRLSSGSPCIDTGTNVSIPADGSPDMGAFEYNGVGTIQVISNRSDASFSIFGPQNYSGSGTDWSILNTPIGVYSICFTPIEGLYTPGYDAQVLMSNEIITFDGTYPQDATPPEGEISINYHEHSTVNSLVDIVLSFSDEVGGMGEGAKMKFSNDVFNWSPAEPYSSLKKNWDLTQYGGNSLSGVKTVHIKVSDALGNWVETPVTDTILYVPDRQILKVPAQYATIQAAIDAAADGDMVYVAPGTYEENITLKKGIRLQGAGPKKTILNSPVAGKEIVKGADNSMVDGFTINGRVGSPGDLSIVSNNVIILTWSYIKDRPIFRNNVFKNSKINITGNKAPKVIIENNTFVNGNSPIDLQSATPGTKVYIRNNIIANNDGWGICDSSIDKHTHIFSSFNNFWNNADGNYGGQNEDKISTVQDIDTDPLFQDADNGDFTLKNGSPSINSGHPDDRYNDPDGTRNDRGAYGGPRLNTPPQADFSVNPKTGDRGTEFNFDASASHDKECQNNDLYVRWDWENDGVYDTTFTKAKTATHQYSSLGTKTVKLEVKDEGGFVSDTTKELTVLNRPPNAPSNPSPANGSTDQPINTALSFSGEDPDPADTVTFDIYFGKSSNPPLVAENHPETTYNPGTLDCHTFYYWKVVAKDNHGDSSLSPTWSFITEVDPVPNPPANLSATTVSPTQIDLSWEDKSNNETGFKIERKTANPGTYSQIAIVYASNYSDTGISSKTTYQYRARSYNPSGNSLYSNEAGATTPNNPPLAQFTYEPDSDDGPHTGEPISFIDQSQDLDGTIVSCVWDFGDGTIPVSAQSPSHTYSYSPSIPIEGVSCSDILSTFTVQLTVIDDGPSPLPEITTTTILIYLDIYRSVANYHDANNLIDSSEILQAIVWWADIDDVPCTNKRTIPSSDILQMIVMWADITPLSSTFGAIGADEDLPPATAIRTITPKHIAPGETFEVTVQITANQDITGLLLDEDLVGYPEDWSSWQVTSIEDDGSSFSPGRVEWLWIDINQGETKTVTYQVTAPQTAATGEYSINGTLSSAGPSFSEVITGDTTFLIGINIPPQVTITSPASDDIVYGIIDIIASATDDAGIARVEFYRNSAFIASDATNSYSCSFDTTDVSDGTCTLSAIAYDIGGLSATDSIAVTVDNTDPEADITHPASGDTISGVIDIQGVAWDTNFDEYTLEYGTGTNPSSWTTITTSTTPVSHNALATWDTTSVENEVYTIKLTVSDAVGNSKENKLAVRVENLPNLVLTKAVDKIQANPNEILTYIIIYTNSGDIPAKNTVIIDVIPSNTTLYGTATGAGTTIDYYKTDGTPGWVSNPAGHTITKIRWTFNGDINPGVNGNFSFQVKIN